MLTSYCVRFVVVAPRFSSKYNSSDSMLVAVASIMGSMVVSALLGTCGSSTWTFVFLLTTVVSVCARVMYISFQSSFVDDRLNKPRISER